MLQRFVSTKFLMTAGMLLGVFLLKFRGVDVSDLSRNTPKSIGVFLLKFRGVDVSDLSLVLPLILAFYTGGNVAQDFVNKKYGSKDTKKQDGDE